MRDDECVTFLQWALPQFQMRWAGFRKVRGQVCKRIQRRINVLDLDNVSAYREYLEENEAEWSLFDELCRVSISRFYRDKRVFGLLEQEVIPMLAQQTIARGGNILKVWSVGCSSGEEPYTLALLWALRLQPQFPGLRMTVLASDADTNMIRRATVATYRYGTLMNLPQSWLDEGFYQHGEWFSLKPEYQRDIDFTVQDVRRSMPDEKFDLVLCRNLVFTYYDEALQRETLVRIGRVIREGGALVLGVHEMLPEGEQGFEVWSRRLCIFRKTAATA